MDESKRNLEGSKKRDVFKRMHKQLDKSFYACDADFCLISKHPPGTVAYLDYKASYDTVTFSEAIQYNEWVKSAPVYIVIGDNPETGPFVIRRYLGANWKPDPPQVDYDDEEVMVKDWHELGEWERLLREEYSRRNGWRGILRHQS